jgi:hypothetical protein
VREQDVRDDTVSATFPFVEPKEKEEDGAGDQRPNDMSVDPWESASSPVKAKQKECYTDGHQERADGVTRPDELGQLEARVIGRWWPVESKQSDRSHSMECGLHPENISLNKVRNQNNFWSYCIPSLRG